MEVVVKGASAYTTTAAATYAYANIHGDVVVAADQTGTRGQVTTYDPFGTSSPLSSTTPTPAAPT